MYRVTDFFAAAGGFSLGMGMAGFHTSFTLDFNRDAVPAFVANHPKENRMSVSSDATDYPSIMFAFARGINVVVGGPPCQAFSNAVRRDPSDPRARLFKEFVTLLRMQDIQNWEIKPSAFIFENVEGLARIRGGAALAEIEQALAESGYRLPTQVLDAWDYVHSVGAD